MHHKHFFRGLTQFFIRANSASAVQHGLYIRCILCLASIYAGVCYSVITIFGITFIGFFSEEVSINPAVAANFTQEFFVACAQAS